MDNTHTEINPGRNLYFAPDLVRLRTLMHIEG